MPSMKDRARIEWVTQHRFLCHEIQQLAAEGDKVCQTLQRQIWDECHLRPRQVSFALYHIRDLRPDAYLGEFDAGVPSP